MNASFGSVEEEEELLPSRSANVEGRQPPSARAQSSRTGGVLGV
jgi:hypothetical protein